MTDFERGLQLYDRPDIVQRLFFPRRESALETDRPKARNHSIEVGAGISIVCRFYPTRDDAPNILFSHGNGETAPDYDYVAPVYRKLGLNLFVTDYRGYGMSDGDPTCSAMIQDAHPLFQGFIAFLEKHGFTGSRYVMGRSLGSAPAIEIAYHYQKQLQGLIVESGFASARNQLKRIGMAHLLRDDPKPVGLGNDLKIREVLIPTLIIHGEGDEIIPVAEGRSLYDLAGTDRKSTLFIPRAGHNNLMMLGLKAYMGALETFIVGS
jgi:alpha-beta hydrolase superfamily lysophospholipase